MTCEIRKRVDVGADGEVGTVERPHKRREVERSRNGMCDEEKKKDKDEERSLYAHWLPGRNRRDDRKQGKVLFVFLRKVRAIRIVGKSTTIRPLSTKEVAPSTLQHVSRRGSEHP